MNDEQMGRVKSKLKDRDKEDGIIYGDSQKDDYFIIERNEKMYVVHADYFGYTSAVLFAVGGDVHEETDWSDGMLLKVAKEVVDGLNRSSGYLYSKDDYNA